METKFPNLCKGIRKPRFRQIKHWTVTNEILYGILLIRGVTLSEFAEVVGVNPRTVDRWIYEDSNPNEDNQELIADLLGYPKEILFYQL